MHSNPTAKKMFKLLQSQQRTSGDWFSKTFNDFLDFAVWRLSHGEIMPHDERVTTSPVLAELFELWAQTEQLEDTLGELYMEIISNYKASAMGQYFTPMSVSLLIAGIALGSPTARKQQRFYEPTCGSGANILASVQVLEQEYKSNRLNHVYWAGDLDLMCVKMCAVQCALNSVPLAVWHMDTLKLEVYGGYKVCFIEMEGRLLPKLMMLNDVDLKAWEQVFPPAPTPPKPQPTKPAPPPTKPTKPDQFSLF